MKITSSYPQLQSALLAGGLAVIPTDTILGVVAQALKLTAVARLYQVREREATKPSIILLRAVADLNKFGVQLDALQKAKLDQWWPGPISVILGDRAFRVPALPWLRDLINTTGPLLAPSANKPGAPPAATLDEAEKIFGEQVDIYYAPANWVQTNNQPSTLVRLAADGSYEVLRPGAGRV